jgi:hypothetical protein
MSDEMFITLQTLFKHMVRDRGKKGRHGDTDRAIMLLVILRGESLPDGVPKRIIYEQIERNTGIDREGVKRRIKELTRNPAIQGILEETNRGGRSYFRVNVSNLYDLSRLYVFLMPALEASRAISSSIREYFDRHMNAFFTDFVDYFRLWKPFDHEWGMPPDFLIEPSLMPPGKEEDLEAVYIQTDGQIVSEELPGTYNAHREAVVFHPEYYPVYGTEKIKWVLSQAIKGEGYSFISPDFIDLLPAVKEVHEYFTEMENFHKDRVPPEMIGYFDVYPYECGVPLSALDNDVVKAAVFSFIEKLHELPKSIWIRVAAGPVEVPRGLSEISLERKIKKAKTMDEAIHGLLELSFELDGYLRTLEHMSYNPYIRMIRHGNATTWAFCRLYEADAEERDSDDTKANKHIDAANEAVKEDPYAWMLASGSDNHGSTLKHPVGKVSGEDISTDEIYTPDF